MRPLVALVLLCGVAGEARAFVRASNRHGTPVAWDGGCVAITPTEGGAVNVGEERSMTQLQAAIDDWESATRDCSYMRFSLQPRASTGGVGYDGINHVSYLHRRWGVEDDDGFVPYDTHAAAITTIHFIENKASPNDGRIVDGDIELNAVDFTYGVLGVARQSGVTDIENTLVHELGHLIGLDHTCADGSRRTLPLDHRSMPVPRCSESPPSEVIESTMYNYADVGEIKKRTPEGDDVAGFCAIYPLAADPGECDPGERWIERGCSAAAGARGGSLGAIAAGLALLGLALRRRPR